jgi:hypothetical protein
VNNAMIDLETLDTGENAVVLSIGVQLFNTHGDPMKWGLGLDWYKVMPWAEQFDLGRTASASTLKWWLQQGDDARREIALASQTSAGILLCELGGLLEDVDFVYGNPVGFDGNILRSLYRSYGYSEERDALMKVPFTFRQQACYRTLKHLTKGYEDLVEEDYFEGTQHHALDDAKHQAWHCIKMLRVLHAGLQSQMPPV